MTVTIKPRNQPCLCQKIFNWQPEVVCCKWLGHHPNPAPHQKGESFWYWFKCKTCGTKTHVSDNYQSAITEWTVINRNEQQHRDLWLRDYKHRQQIKAEQQNK